MALDDLQPSKAREFRAKSLMPGRENGQFTMDQPLLMEAAAEPAAHGIIRARCGWVEEEGVIDPTNNGGLGGHSPNSSIFVG